MALVWSQSDAGPAASAEREAPKESPGGMALVPAGEFIYGPSEREQKLVLPAFYIDLYEVTNQAYAKARPHQYPEGKDNYPVVGTSWRDAQRYCEAMGKRLPTEQEWEKAARGTDGRRYPWGDLFDPTKANTGRQFGGITPVDKFPEGRSPYGVYDLLGNVWEWTASEDGANKVVRGGLWFDAVIGTKASYRNSFPPGKHLEYLGFRCAKDAKP
jgi:serine/threonine-protein kinase